MKLTLTVRESNRDDVLARIRYAAVGTRIAFLDPEATEPQRIKLDLMLEEFARKANWNDRKLVAKDWRRMFLAAARNAEVGPGVEEDTVYVMFSRDDDPSVIEASNMIELLHKYAAQSGFALGDLR